jgi:hypothetical protein
MSLSHSPKIVTDGLVLCLDAANPRSYPKSGTTWSDLAGSNDATLINIVPSTDFSQDNRGIFTFDGSNQYASFNKPSQIVNNGSISLVLWAKWTTTGTTTSSIQSLVDNFHGSVGRFTLQDRPDLSKKLTFFIGRNSNGIQSSGQVGDGTWKHISCTNDGSTSRIYINGELDNSLAGETGIRNVYDYINIGRWGNQARYLNGQVSGLLIYDRALTADEVRQNYNATKRRFK